MADSKSQLGEDQLPYAPGIADSLPDENFGPASNSACIAPRTRSLPISPPAPVLHGPGAFCESLMAAGVGELRVRVQPIGRGRRRVRWAKATKVGNRARPQGAETILGGTNQCVAGSPRPGIATSDGLATIRMVCPCEAPTGIA